jgi:phosphoribosylamine--glycine ligase
LADDSFHKCFHAGTKTDDDATLANGGRVLNITARGDTLKQAQERAYAELDKVEWNGGFYRRDIGWRAL